MILAPVALLLLVLLGPWVNTAVAGPLRSEHRSELLAPLRASTDGLAIRFSAQEERVRAVAEDADLRAAAFALLRPHADAGAEALRAHPAQVACWSAWPPHHGFGFVAERPTALKLRRCGAWMEAMADGSPSEHGPFATGEPPAHDTQNEARAVNS